MRPSQRSARVPKSLALSCPTCKTDVFPGRQVIVTSYLFPSATFSLDRLRSLAALVGKDRLVVDVSCRKRDGGWWVAMDKWTRITDLEVTKGSFEAIL